MRIFASGNPDSSEQAGQEQNPVKYKSIPEFLGLAIAFFVLAWIGNWLNSPNLCEPVLWPQLGLAFAVFAWSEKTSWPIVVAAFVSGMAALWFLGWEGTALDLLVMAIGFAACAAGAWSYRQKSRQFDPTADIFSLGVFSATSLAIGLIVAASQCLVLLMAGEVSQGMSISAVGQLIAVTLSLLVCAPPSALLLGNAKNAFRAMTNVETFVLLGLAIALLVYDVTDSSERAAQLSNLLFILILLLTATRCHLLASTAMTFCLTVTDLYLNLRGISFTNSATFSHEERTMWVQAFESVRCFAVLLISASSTSARRVTFHEKVQTDRLASIIDTSNDGVITINEHGIVDSFNRAAGEIFGFSSEEVIGKNVSILMPAYYRERHDGYLERYLATGERRIIGIGRVVTGQRRDGSTFPMELSVGEVKLGARRIFTGFVRDISARQETELRLHELQEELFHVSRVSAMGELASAIAHELNQPLAAIKNYAMAGKLMLEKRKNVKDLPDMFDKVSEQAGRAGDVIKRLRNFIANKRVEAVPTDIYQVITEAAALALIGAKEEGIKTTFVRDPNIPQIMIDRVQIQQVLINLIRNAVDAMRDATVKELFVEARRVGDSVQIRVCDTGPGVPPDSVDKLFVPFFSSKQGGMGIGLSISRAIAEAHDGALHYEANPVGGAVFILTLPTTLAKGRWAP